MDKMKEYFKIIKLFEKRKTFSLLIFLNTIVIITMVSLPQCNAVIINHIEDKTIYQYIFLTFFVILIKEITSVIFSFEQQKSLQLIERNLIKRTIQNWMKKDEYQRNEIGYIKVFESLQTDCREVSRMATFTSMLLFENVVKFILITIMVIRIHLLIFGILLISGILTYVLYFNKVSKKQKKLEESHFNSLQKINQWIEGIYDTYEFISIHRLKEWAKKNLINEIEQNYQYRTLQNTYSTWKGRLSYLPIWICECMIYIVGGYYSIRNKLSLGELLALISYTSMFLKAVRNLLDAHCTFQVQKNSYQRINQLEQGELKEEVDFNEGKGKIVLNSVTFVYDNHLIFDQVSLQLPLQGMVLIQGKNGTGKSTLLKLIKGDLKAEQGIVSIDGQQSSLEVSHTYLSQVKQEDVILNDTLENNIIFFDRNDNKCVENLIHSFISDQMKCTDYVSYDSLSGGEKRSLSVARALYHKKLIILLDEADTGMDQEKWNHLVKCLRDISGSILVLAITHRELSDSEFLKWDYIIRLENKKIVIEALRAGCI